MGFYPHGVEAVGDNQLDMVLGILPGMDNGYNRTVGCKYLWILEGRR